MRKTYALEIKGRQYVLGRRTWIMGILNVTPDSFSDGGIYFEKENAIERGLKMIDEGADIIDIGGESTRPGSVPVSEAEEAGRVLPVIQALRERTKSLLSVDTTKAAVADEALRSGADMVNDTSALRFDPQMGPVAARHGGPIVLMHMKGRPETMQDDPRYTDLLGEISSFLRESIMTARSAGIEKRNIILDPGIGFGKRPEDNLILINRLDFLAALDCPVLSGVSRKAFIGRILGLPADERSEGTLAASVLSIARGAHILRVHDVKAVRRAADVADAILSEEIERAPAEKRKNEYAG